MHKFKNKFTPKQTDNKRIKNAKRHVYDGITFKSGLEVFCYQQLKEAKLKFEYEERVFVLQDPFTYNQLCVETKLIKNKATGKMVKSLIETPTHKIRAISYTPDFVYIVDKKGWIIECKGFKTPEFALRNKLFKMYLETSGYEVNLFLPSNHSEVISCINKIKQLYKSEIKTKRSFIRHTRTNIAYRESRIKFRK